MRYIILKVFIVSFVFLNFSVFGQEAQDDEYADKITNPDYSYTQDEEKEEEEEYLTQKYIDHSLKEFKDEVKLVFSDSPEDIEWCKHNMDAEHLYFIGGDDDVFDFEFMRRCDHNVISNSSFSWWAAWLNEQGPGVHRP